MSERPTAAIEQLRAWNRMHRNVMPAGYKTDHLGRSLNLYLTEDIEMVLDYLATVEAERDRLKQAKTGTERREPPRRLYAVVTTAQRCFEDGVGVVSGLRMDCCLDADQARGRMLSAVEQDHPMSDGWTNHGASPAYEITDAMMDARWADDAAAPEPETRS